VKKLILAAAFFVANSAGAQSAPDILVLARETEAFIEENRAVLHELSKTNADRAAYSQLVYRPALDVYKKWPTPASKLPDGHYIFCFSWLGLYMAYADDYFKSGGKGIQPGEDLMDETRTQCQRFLKKQNSSSSGEVALPDSEDEKFDDGNEDEDGL
jgi:hypothetical protein